MSEKTTNTNKLLNFKFGTYDGLKNVAPSEGTVYVTTDEKAMYVDLGGNRIRLGQIIELTTQDWEQLTPPYSNEAYYYLTDSNALLKYVDSKWVQINSTADIKNLIGFIGIVNNFPANSTPGQICIKDGQGYVYNGTQWSQFGSFGTVILDLTTRVTSNENSITELNQSTETIENELDVVDKRLEGIVPFKGIVNTLPEITSNNKLYDMCILKTGNTEEVYVVIKDSNKNLVWEKADSVISALSNRIEVVAAAAGDKNSLDTLTTDFNAVKNSVSAILQGAGSDIDSLLKLYNTVNNLIEDLKDYSDNNFVKKDDFDKYKTDTINPIQEIANAASAALGTILGGQPTLDTFKKVEEKFDDYVTNDTLTSKENEINKSFDTVNTNYQALANELSNFKSTNDAMVYKGMIEKVADLPAEASCGETYKVIVVLNKADFQVGEKNKLNSLTTSETINIGDLLVATGKEDNGIISSDTLVWDHIPSGYQADYNPSLGTSVSNNIATVTLTSAHAPDGTAGDLGKFNIFTQTDSIEINPVEENICINMIWGTF